jgi:hypothetical protein
MSYNPFNEIMEMGWNVFLECKGRGREYEMTFEATASKVYQEGMTLEESMKSFYPVHAVGNTIEEIVEKLKYSIAEWESWRV